MRWFEMWGNYSRECGELVIQALLPDGRWAYDIEEIGQGHFVAYRVVANPDVVHGRRLFADATSLEAAKAFATSWAESVL